jgi:ABC-type branched-subunit amino acid transport system substrate-binding protein
MTRRAVATAGLLALLAGALAACTTAPRLGVSTTVVAPGGTCDHARVVEVGASLPLSGSQQALGREYLTGLRMAVQHVDATGGLLSHHRCLELLYKDDRGSVSIARQAVLDLVNREQVTFLISPVLSTQVHGARAALAAANLPVGSFSSLDETFRRAALPWTFPLASSTSSVTRAMVTDARAQGWQQLAIVAVDDPVGREGASSLAAAAQRSGLRVAGTAVTTARDAASALARLRTMQPSGLAVVGDTLDVGAVLAARRTLGWQVPVVASPIAVDPSVLRAIGRDALSGVRVVVPQAIVAQPGISDADVRHFRDVLRAQLHGSTIDGSIVPYAQGYDAVAMLASAAEGSHSLAASNLRTFLESAGYQGLLASYQYTTASHTGIPADQQVVAPASTLNDGLFDAASP